MPTAADVRRIALALPGALEKETWGHPTFRVGAKMFAGMAEDGSTVSVKAARDEQTALLAEDPDVFFVPPYSGVHGWVGVRLALVDPAELRDLLVEAWRRTAGKRAVRAYDTAHPNPEPPDPGTASPDPAAPGTPNP